MKLINQTDLELDLDDLLNREWWTVERNGLEIQVKPMKPLDDWAVVVSWKRGKKPYAGHCCPSRKLTEVKLNPRNSYPFVERWAVGTEQISPTLYRYKLNDVVFDTPNELVRFIFCHEFSHVLDYLQGFNLRMKQTKANRFALRHYKKEAGA